MKKILLIALIGTVAAVTSTFACDTCAKHTKSADGAKMVCPADCDKPSCAEKKECCGIDGKCCAEKKAACGEKCDKPCSADKKAETATKTEGAAPCCPGILGKAA